MLTTLREVLAALADHDVDGDLVRVGDHDVASV
jgi:hypothetical protein